MPFPDIQDVIVQTLLYLPAQDVEAFTVAYKRISTDILPTVPIWKELFRRHWQELNFALAPDIPIQLAPGVDKLFSKDCSENRMYQLLTHAMICVPSTMNLFRTRNCMGETLDNQRVEALLENGRLNPGCNTATDFAYTGRILGDDRSVRANVPFINVLHPIVVQRRDESNLRYEIGLTTGGYFELSITKRVAGLGTIRIAPQSEDTIAIGLGTRQFLLHGKQPGWDSRSMGYHGDDGSFYYNSASGTDFGRPYGAGDVVGCGIYMQEDSRTLATHFTRNGGRIHPTGDVSARSRLPPNDWYPVIGIDTPDGIHVNFGQEPFSCTEVIDMHLREAIRTADLTSQPLEWHRISDYKDWSESEGDESDYDESDMDVDEFWNFYRPYFRNTLRMMGEALAHGEMEAVEDAEDTAYSEYDDLSGGEYGSDMDDLDQLMDLE